MSKRKDPAAGIVLNAYDDLFETDESRAEKLREPIYEIPLTQIADFPDHPYKVKDDENMTELIASIKEYGLLQPVTVRKIEEDHYEMIAGHRRKRAYKLAGMETIPCRVKEISRDEAILLMVDSNLQRERILPSEKAFAYRMRLEAMNSQGKRTDLTCEPLGHKLKGVKSRDLLAEQVGESHTQIQRYIRMTYLIPELLSLVDEGRIKLRTAVEISYLSKEEQTDLLSVINETEKLPSYSNSVEIRKNATEGTFDKDSVKAFITKPKPKPLISDPKVLALIPDSIPIKEHYDYIVKALETYNRYLEKKRNRDAR